MASSRRSELPTLRITFKQLEERSKEICMRDSSQLTPRRYRDSESAHINEKSVNASKCQNPQSIAGSACAVDREFQIKPTSSKPEVVFDTITSSRSSARGGSQHASEGQRSTTRSSRGRGYKRSRGDDVSSSLGKLSETSSEASVISNRGVHVQPVFSVRGRSRGGGEQRVTRSKGAREDLVSVWKSYCNGRIERDMSTWLVTGEVSRFEEAVRTVRKFQALSERLLINKLEASSKLDVCNKLWKVGHYPVIEALRKQPLATSQDETDRLIVFLDSAHEFYSSLLEILQSVYGFQLTELLAGREEYTSKTQLRMVMMAVNVCHHCYISLGDVSRYRQQMAPKPDWGKPRIFYLKARELAPKDGRPHNQLAVVALNAHRRLDAFYFYMRSLMTKNSFKSAHDSLVGLFEDTSTKAKKLEEEERRKKQKAEQEAARKLRRAKKQRNKHRHHHASPNKSRHEELFQSGRREHWIMPGYEEMERSGGAMGVSTVEERGGETVVPDEQPSSQELIKRLVSAFLVAHGKLFTKIGIETFEDSLQLLSSLWTATLKHDLTLSDAPRLIKMMVINIFSLHHAAENHSDTAAGQHVYCSLGLTLTLSLTSTLLKVCLLTLNESTTVIPKTGSNPPVPTTSSPTPPSEKQGGLIDLDKTEDVDESAGHLKKIEDPVLLDKLSLLDSVGSVVMPTDDSAFKIPPNTCISAEIDLSEYPPYTLSSLDTLSRLLPAVRVWFQWMYCQRELLTEWESGVDDSILGEFWTSTCSLLNDCLLLFPGLSVLINTAVNGNSGPPRLWEDRMLAGFSPLGGSISTQDTFKIQEVSTLLPEQLREQTIARIVHIAQVSVHLSQLDFDPTIATFIVNKKIFYLIEETTPTTTDPISDTSATLYQSLADRETSPDKEREQQDEECVTDSSDDDIIVEGYSSEEEIGVQKDETEATSTIANSPSEIELLKAQRETLTRKMEKHSLALETAKTVLSEATKNSDFQVTINPKYLVPDTNCFVDMLSSIKTVVHATHFVVALPLTVVTELEGLSKGSVRVVPEKAKKRNTAEVSTGAKAALDYINEMFSSKSPYMKGLTTQGNLLSSLAYRAEITDKGSNDDLILESCVQLHSKVDKGDKHSVVLLTDDRNLRVKAHATNLPVKNMPDFMKLLTRV